MCLQQPQASIAGKQLVLVGSGCFSVLYCFQVRRLRLSTLLETVCPRSRVLGVSLFFCLHLGIPPAEGLLGGLGTYGDVHRGYLVCRTRWWYSLSDPLSRSRAIV